MAGERNVPVWETGMRELAPGVYAYVQAGGGWFVSNTGLVVGSDSAIVIDSLGTIGFNLAFLEEVRKVTDKPVRYLVNTHHHGDHIYGNHLFPGAAIVCQARCREETLRTGQPNPAQLSARFPGLDFAGVRMTPPDITFEKQLVFHSGGQEVRLVHYGAAHTVGDSIAWLPQSGIVFAGDLLFLYSTPLCMQGSFSGWIEAMNAMLALDARVYVPGNGPPCGREGIVECLDYLSFLRAEAKKRFDAGLTDRDAASSIPIGSFRGWANWERVAANVSRLYAEFRGEDPLSPLDFAGVFRQMDEMARAGEKGMGGKD